MRAWTPRKMQRKLCRQILPARRVQNKKYERPAMRFAPDPPSVRTLRPVVRVSTHAISTRKPQATQVGDAILRSGGNAFDAAVAAFAVLAVTDPAMTGFGG